MQKLLKFTLILLLHYSYPIFSAEDQGSGDIEHNETAQNTSQQTHRWSMKKKGLIVGSSLLALSGLSVGTYFLVDHLNDDSPVNDTLCLPQNDPNAQQRSLDLLSIQNAIENEARYHAHDGSTYLEIPRGPVPYEGSLAEKLIYEESLDFNSRVTVGSQEVVLGAFANPAFKLDTLEDFEHMYGMFEPHIPSPHALENWSNDTFFGDLRRTYLGHKIVKISRPWFDLGLSDQQLEELLGHSNGLSNTALYGLDLWDAQNYNANDGRPQYAAGAQAIFAEKDGSLIPIGIKLSNNLVYTPFDSENDWTLAKIALNVAETLWTSANHFMVTHLVVEPIRVEMLRFLSTKHPVHALLAHHLKNIFVNTVAGLQRLFTDGTTLDGISGWGAKGYMEYFAGVTRQRVDFNSTFENDMNERDLKDLPNYRQYEDTQKVLQGVKTFVRNYLFTYYTNNPEKELKADTELQEWARACASTLENGGNVLNFPSSIETFDQLVDVVTHVIYLTSIKHHAMNSNALWHGSPFPGASLALWAPLPEAKGSNFNLRDYLPPAQLVPASVLQFEAFLRRLSSEDSLTYSYTSAKLGSRSDSIIRKFQETMIDLQREIRTREDNSESVHYDILSPERLPFFIWI